MARQKKNKDEINDLESRFLSIYISNGFNATAAYLLASPGVQYETAKTEGNKLLTKPHVQNSLELRKLEIRNAENIELSFLVKALKGVIYDVQSEGTERSADGRITSKPSRQDLIKAVDTLAKLAGLYTQKVDVTSNGNDILQEITVNIIKPKEE
jgi:phage terminase small subunit